VNDGANVACNNIVDHVANKKVGVDVNERVDVIIKWANVTSRGYISLLILSHMNYN
jgi:hypothetical protein